MAVVVLRADDVHQVRFYCNQLSIAQSSSFDRNIDSNAIKNTGKNTDANSYGDVFLGPVKPAYLSTTQISFTALQFN